MSELRRPLREVAMKTALPCPRCVQTVRVSEEDPDASLSDLWDHLGIHEYDRQPRTEMFVWSQQHARSIP